MKKMKRVILLSGAIAAVLAGAGCSRGGEGDTKLTWYMPGVKTDSSYDDVFKAVDDKLSEKYGLGLDIRLIDSKNFSQKMQMMNASREKYDLVFTSNWSNNFYTNVDNGALADLTDVLKENAPNVYKSLSKSEKDAVTVNGKMYAVPNWQVQARAAGFCFPKEMVEKTGIDIDSINSFEDLEPYLASITSENPECNKIGGGWHHAMTYYGMVTVVQQGLPGAVYYNKSGKPEVINQYETEEFARFAKLMRKWVNDGYSSGVLGTKDYRKKEYKQTPVWWDGWKPGQDIEDSNNYGYDIVTKQISPAVISAESILGTLTGISANSAHINEACRMIEVFNTDKEIYNLLAWGIDGKDYEKVSDNIIKINDDSTYSMSNWMIGSVENSYIIDGNSADLWEKTRSFNDAAVVSALNGFSPDNSSFNAELGNCETVVKEYLDTIQFGLADPDETIAKFNADLKVAGVDTVLAEVQKQIDKWWETQNK